MLFPAACATGALYVAMEAAFSLFFSAMVISHDTKYGPIGVIFALLSYLIAIGVVVILGAVVGLVWHERLSRHGETGHLPPPSWPPPARDVEHYCGGGECIRGEQ